MWSFSSPAPSGRAGKSQPVWWAVTPGESEVPPPPNASVQVWFIWFFWSFHRLQLVTEGQVNQLVLQEVEKCSSQWSFRGFPV